jgi:hypothetical protein
MAHTHIWVRPYLTHPHIGEPYITWLCHQSGCPTGGAVIRSVRVPSGKATH